MEWIEPDALALTIKDFCRIYAVGRSDTYELIRDGKLHAVKVGKRTLITSQSAQSWWNDLLDASTAPSTPDLRIVAHDGARLRRTKSGQNGKPRFSQRASTVVPLWPHLPTAS